LSIRELIELSQKTSQNIKLIENAVDDDRTRKIPFGTLAVQVEGTPARKCPKA
jgi:hypothetical protein